MGHIDYRSLRGKVHAFAPAEPTGNPHLWVIVEAGGAKYFATINVRSNKDAPGDPIGLSYLYYLTDHDFDHPIVPRILERPLGMAPVERSYAGGAIDFHRGNLFDPNNMRVLPAQGPGDDGLVHQLGALLQAALSQSSDIVFYGNAFHKDNPHQTDAAFGYTPDAPFGLDNIHMSQGDPHEINVRLRENGVWHDGAAFVWDAPARRMTAIFLAFQSQGWHTNSSGDLIGGATGCEAPRYDYSGPTPRLVLPLERAAEITSAHKNPDGAGSAVIANMSAAPLDLVGWRLMIDAEISFPLPPRRLDPGEPMSVPLPAGALDDRGGLVTLINAANLRVDGEAYRGGDGAKGWSTSFR
ncbi:MAG: DUF2278 family protein [Roseiarcus sp.]